MESNFDGHHHSFPQLKYPPIYKKILRTPHQWLKSKQLQDGAEGLWRINNSLYDLNKFISSHPGGAQWITLTKGTDITETFETHHLKGIAETLLPKYYVREAVTPRNSPFTFESDGFYKTLKSKVILNLHNLPLEVERQSDEVTDLLLIALIITSPICCWLWKNYFILSMASIGIVGFVLNGVSIAAHNYFHRKDNWRMYLFNISGISYEDWRIIHILSHHLHTNTLNDMEIGFLDPFLQYMPRKDKSVWARMGALYYPAMTPFMLLANWLKEIIAAALNIEGKTFCSGNLIPFFLPTWMLFTGGLSLLDTIIVWVGLLMASSFFFFLFALTAGHLNYHNFFDGDVPRDERIDWGLYQMDTIVYNEDYLNSHFQSLTRFGDHTLHHFFPTLDQAKLKFLYPILRDHCEKYNVKVRSTTFYQSFLDHSKQLLRKHPKNFKEM